MVGQTDNCEPVGHTMEEPVVKDGRSRRFGFSFGDFFITAFSLVAGPANGELVMDSETM